MARIRSPRSISKLLSVRERGSYSVPTCAEKRATYLKMLKFSSQTCTVLVAALMSIYIKHWVLPRR